MHHFLHFQSQYSTFSTEREKIIKIAISDHFQLLLKFKCTVIPAYRRCYGAYTVACASRVHDTVAAAFFTKCIMKL